MRWYLACAYPKPAAKRRLFGPSLKALACHRLSLMRWLVGKRPSTRWPQTRLVELLRMKFRTLARLQKPGRLPKLRTSGSTFFGGKRSIEVRRISERLSFAY